MVVVLLVVYYCFVVVAATALIQMSGLVMDHQRPQSLSCTAMQFRFTQLFALACVDHAFLAVERDESCIFVRGRPLCSEKLPANQRFCTLEKN